MRIALAVPSINSVGGVTRFVISLIRALKELGHSVVLCSLERTRWHSLHKVCEEVVLPDEERYLTSDSRLLPRSIKQILTGVALAKAKDVDLSMNVASEFMLFPADVVYVHTSPRTLFYLTGRVIDRGQVCPTLASALRGSVYAVLQRLLRRIHSRTRLFLTNSLFSKLLLRMAGIRSCVLYPPVDVERFLRVRREHDLRKPRVLSIMRIAPDKRVEHVLEIAKLSPDVEYVIVGSCTPRYRRYLLKLKRMIHRMGLKDRVRILTNVPVSSLMKLMEDCRLYLHTMPFEHFGIAVVEAMAAGLVPVVHRSGGPWIDILRRRLGEHGFAYSTVKEAAEIISAVIHDVGTLNKISQTNRDYVMRFSYREFKRRLATILSNVGH